MKKALLALFLIGLAACGDDPVAPVPDPTVTGAWLGTIDGMSLEILLNQAPDGDVTGSGTAVLTLESVPLTVTSGTHVFPDLSLVFDASSFEGFALTGKVSANEISARLNGSGFVNEVIVLVRQ